MPDGATGDAKREGSRVLLGMAGYRKVSPNGRATTLLLDAPASGGPLLRALMAARRNQRAVP